MTTKKRPEPSEAQSETGWSLDVPDQHPAESAASDDSPCENDQPESPIEEEATTHGRLTPDHGKENGLEHSSDSRFSVSRSEELDRHDHPTA
jgi:hypothetical protein